ncbi:Aromatic hydrocarbon utilization transcriptional regulator CatR (LysR family) [Euzebya pacifica]|uniref:Aromatic hydrocarbon utilization transcriptional regulator CatR (LysR family) n=1 Tax=Euzebya pacifica TaxID=1608957 RepID=A0A346Y3G2_9ACTN|nr:LysR family transcriptional regulator [Euzebya pacifica]AXV09009.1 Aromatic hydrocarbon utilization transcriptional regulator CatR (LysR family) [Euzebya pacifica]
MLPDTRQLECFVAVAEEGHIGRAAARLHLTQPPLTRRIKRLERDLDVELFVREPSGVRLTAPGEALLVEARRILALTDKAVTLTRRVSAGEEGHLLVGWFGSTVFAHVPQLLGGFARAHPGIDVVLERVPKAEQADALRDGLLHIGFGRLYAEEDGLVVRHLATEPLALAVPAGGPHDGDAPVGIDDLRGVPMVLYPRARPSFADQILRECEEAGFAPEVAHEAGDVVGALSYVALGSAVAIVPRSARNVALPGVVHRPLTGVAGVEFSCLHPEAGRPPALEALLSYLDAVHEGGAEG